MLAVIFYGHGVVYDFRERRMCRSDFYGTVSLGTERRCSFFVFGRWGMFAALAYLNTQRDAMDGVRYKCCSKPVM